jgi:hypothetical protein
LPLLLLALGASSGFAQQQLTDPFTPSERWSRYIHRTYDPARLGLLGADIAIDHLLREPACWDLTASSYGRRYGRALERRIIKNTAELGAGILTGEDLRYRVSRSHFIPARIWNAVQSSVTARMPDGTRRPAYTRFFATAVTDVSTANWTNQRIQPGWLLPSLAWSALDQMQTNLMDEFGPDLRRTAGRIWKLARPHH